jgi:L-cysteine desulfidase
MAHVFGCGPSGGLVAAAAAAAAIGRGPVAAVHILKDPCGMLRVQVPGAKPQGPPSVTLKGLAGGCSSSSHVLQDAVKNEVLSGDQLSHCGPLCS